MFFTYTLNNSTESYDTFETLSYDAETIAGNLMSEGYPKNWDSSNVEIIGLTTNNRINQSKLEEFYNMIYVENNYTRTKNIFNTIYDYYLFFEENMTVGGASREGIGKPGTTLSSLESKNLIRVTRFTIYQNKTIPLYLILWEK